MSEELEQDDQVKEIPAEYVAKFPQYYDRFIEERDRRISAEFSLLRNRVETNTQRINELRDLTLLRFAEATEDRDRVRQEMAQGFEAAAADRDRRFAEATEDRNHSLAEATADRDRRFAEAAEDRNRGLAETATDRVRIRQEMAQGFEAAAADRDRRFAEAAADRMLIRQDITQLRQQVERLESRMESRFRWTIGLMMPVILGILAIIIRIFFGGTP